MKRSRRLNQNDPLSGRSADDASRYREQAGELPPGEERDALQKEGSRTGHGHTHQRLDQFP
jgi:hypothetical protein